MKHPLLQLARLLRFCSNRIQAWVENTQSEESRRGAHQAQVKKAMAGYDMMSRPGEDFYARQYLHWILPECERRFPDGRAAILDVGCGQGRLAIPLAQWARAGVTLGVDLTPESIDMARQYANGKNVANISFQISEATSFLKTLQPETYDIILITEVIYILPDYRDALAAAHRALKPGGLLFATFRSRYYYMAYSIMRRQWDAARMAGEKCEGQLFGPPTWYTWQTAQDIHTLLQGIGFRPLSLRGIGVFSGIDGDPQSALAKPWLLSEDEQRRLMELESAAASHYPESGRYILVSAEK